MSTAIASFDLDRFLTDEQTKDLLRFTTAGSVDDGKSTLIGRLLYDSRNVYEDQIRSMQQASSQTNGGSLDLSLLTDGLRAEREQGITIDVAYRYFGTARRRFIIADTPGHEQYTRNMATGASTADLAIILIDARHGVMEQSRRHAYISALLGISRFVVAVNKMDLVAYGADTFHDIQAAFEPFLQSLNVTGAYYLPISALIGDNVVERSVRMPWFEGPSLFEYLETVEIPVRDATLPFRLAVQRVVRPDDSFRGYAGQIASGVVRPGDAVLALPSGRSTLVKSISTFDGDLDCAVAPMAVTLTLADEIDLSRGDLLCSVETPSTTADRFIATVVWMHDTPLEPGRTYLVKHAARQVKAEFRQVLHRVDVRTLGHESASTLGINEIGDVEIETACALMFDPYGQNRHTGRFIVIDPRNNATVGAGMILQPLQQELRGQSGAMTVAVGPREQVARMVERRLFDQGRLSAVVRDQDIADAMVRTGLIALLLAGGESYGGLTDEEASEDVLMQLAPDY